MNVPSALTSGIICSQDKYHRVLLRDSSTHCLSLTYGPGFEKVLDTITFSQRQVVLQNRDVESLPFKWDWPRHGRTKVVRVTLEVSKSPPCHVAASHYHVSENGNSTVASSAFGTKYIYPRINATCPPPSGNEYLPHGR